MTHGVELPAGAAILEGNIEWIRSLSRSLARDPEGADELAQDACLAALESPAGSIHRSRPWLASVMRNLWRQRGRSLERRRARESAAQRDDRTSEDLVEHVLVFREVAQHVIELHEPYRTAILMRFWEGLPPRVIAARLGTTPATVQNRIGRGLALLRERLDRSRGGREAWLSALLPFVDPPAAKVALSLGGLFVNAKILLASLSVAIAAGALIVWTRTDARGDAASAPKASAEIPSTGDSALGSASQPVLGSSAPSAGREVASSPDGAPAAEHAAPAPKTLRTIRGRVLDVVGVPLAGIALAAGQPSGNQKALTLAKSGPGGWFELETAESGIRLTSADSAWTTVRAATWRMDSTSEPVLVVARALDVAGSVQDAGGEPLASARIRYVLPEGFEARFDRPLEGSVSMGWSAASDAAGHFAIPDMPSIAGAKLRAVLEGFAQAEIAAPVGPDDGAVIVLSRPVKPSVGSLRGRVIDDRGNPVPAARVFLGLASIATDPRGEFALDLARAVSTDRIVAVKTGWRPAVLDRPREPRGEDTGWPSLVELALPGPVLAIRGRVVDGQGKPVPGLRVSIADPTSIGAIGLMPVHAEFLAAGGAIPAIALESESRLPAQDGDRFNDFYARVGAATAFFHYVTTDSDGAFELGGLDDKRYRLHLQEPKTCTYSTTDELRAGAAPERIVWQAPPLWDLVAGTVVDDEGHPVAGARVALEREAFGVHSRVFGGRVYVTLRDPREEVATDESGRFEFRGVPAEGMGVQVRGEGVVPGEFVLAKVGAPGAVKITVHQRCSFEVVVVSPGLIGDQISLQDGNGGEVDILKMDSESTNAYTTAAITDGRSGVLSASSVARVLQLLKDGVVVKSLPLRLRAGEVNRIQM